MATVTLATLQNMRKELVNSRYYLNVRSGYMAPVTLHCSYGDSGETVTFYLFDGGDELDLTGSVASVHGTRKDGASYGPIVCTVSGNAVSFTLQSEMTAVEGGGIAEIVITKSGTSIGTCNFGVMVEDAVFPNGVAYDSDPSIYQDILKYVQSLPSIITTTYEEKLLNEANTRAINDNSLNAQIDTERERIDTYLNSGTAATDSELIDIRVGQDGVSYANAGTSVRTQIINVRNLATTNGLYNYAWGNNLFSHGEDSWYYTPIRIGTANIIRAELDLSVVAASGYRVSVDYYSSGTVSGSTYLNNSGWVSDTIIDRGSFFLLTLKKTDDSNISPTESYNVVASPFSIIRHTFINGGLGLMKWTHYLFYQGEGTDGAWGSTPIRIGTRNMLYAYTYMRVVAETGYKVAANYFTASTPSRTAFVLNTGWQSVIIVPQGTYFLLSFRKDDNSNIDIEECTNCKVVVNGTSASQDSGNYVSTPYGAKLPVTSEYIGMLTNLQAFTIYNGYYYSVATGKFTKQDSNFNVVNDVTIDLGHANTLQRGSGSLAYVCGWNDQKVYVVDLESMTLASTITLPVTGYTGAAIDDINKIAYIFRSDDGLGTTAHNWDFITYDYDHQQILSTKKFTLPFAIIQGTDFFNGRIYLVYGYGTAEAPSGGFVCDINGTVLGVYHVDAISTYEPEGIYMDRDTEELYVHRSDCRLYKIY